MFCTQCGQAHPDGARFCARCGASLAATAAPAPGVPPTGTSGFGAPYAPPPPPAFDPGPAAPSYAASPAYSPPPPAPTPPYAAPAYGPPAPTATPGYAPSSASGPAYAPGYGVAPGPAMEYKGVMPRFFAAIVDGILTSVALAALTFLVGGGIDPEALAAGELSYALAGTPALLVMAIAWGYPILFEGLFGGTIGKLMLGMRVVNAEGNTCGLGRAIVRNLLRIIDALPFAYLLGAIMVSSSDTKQRLGDRVAGTYVVAR